MQIVRVVCAFIAFSIISEWSSSPDAIGIAFATVMFECFRLGFDLGPCGDKS